MALPLGSEPLIEPMWTERRDGQLKNGQYVKDGLSTPRHHLLKTAREVQLKSARAASLYVEQ